MVKWCAVSSHAVPFMRIIYLMIVTLGLIAASVKIDNFIDEYLYQTTIRDNVFRWFPRWALPDTPINSSHEIFIERYKRNKGPLDLFVSTSVSKNPITVGDEQTVSISASDSKSGEFGTTVYDVSIEGRVIDSSGKTVKKFNDNPAYPEGRAIVLYSWALSTKLKPGVFKVIIGAKAPYFKSTSATTSFEVVPVRS